MFPGTWQGFLIQKFHLKCGFEHSAMHMIRQGNYFNKCNTSGYHQLRRLEIELCVASVLPSFLHVEVGPVPVQGDSVETWASQK